MTRPQFLNEVIRDERGWNARTAGYADAWTYRLPDACLEELEQSVGEIDTDEGPVTDIVVRDEQFPKCREAIQPMLSALETGLGFLIIDRLPIERHPLRRQQAIYWMFGQLLGRPFEQNIEGTLLYDVCDMGHDVTRGARFSVTNAESTFHTDHAFGKDVPDYVGLLCLRKAKSGGHSQLVSAYALHNELRQHHADVLESLYRPFCFDRRGQFLDGEMPYLPSPVFNWDGRQLKVRYLHYYIVVGQEKAGKPLTPMQNQALEVLQQLLAAKDLRVQFDLQPGQMLFTNNRWVLHNRTAFEDHPTPAQRRHLVRLWLSRTTNSNTSGRGRECD